MDITAAAAVAATTITINHDADDDDVDDIVSVTEQLFHNTVRENIIFLLLLLLLYLGSYALVKAFRRHDKDDLYSTDDDEILVYRISLWLCTFSLAIAMGAALLLPISIASNEVLLLYPQSYYVKWLNSSLIHGLWNYIFLFSNCALFILLPFSYLFAESTGFYGYRKGIISRVYETLLVFSILAVVVIGLTYLLATVFDSEKSQIQTILNLGSYHLSFLYSCISFLGVILLLVCTPLGFIHLFGIVNQILVKPHLLRDIDEELRVFHLEEACVKRKLEKYKTTRNKNNISNNRYYNNNNNNNNGGTFMNTPYKDFLLFKRYKMSTLTDHDDDDDVSSIYNKIEISYNNNNNNNNNNSNNTFSNSFNTTVNSSGDNKHIKINDTQILNEKQLELIELNKRLSDLNMERKELYKLSRSSSFQRNIIYPTAMILLLFLTGITVLIVLLNTLGILFGIKSLPLLRHHQHHQHHHHNNYEYVDVDEHDHQTSIPIDEGQKFTLGITSLSQFGSIGATIEIFIILYLGITSLVGLYTIPILKYIQPKWHKTSLSQLIVNCTLVLILSSALPLLSRMLGITNFDLLGDFGAIEWLGNFQIVFIYNLIFGATTALCLFKKFTSSVWSSVFW